MRPNNKLQGVIKAFDELKGYGTLLLHQSQQELLFFPSELRQDVSPGDHVHFEVATENGGRLTAVNILKA